jgi:tRNA-uridine 2-sulfurtransferase
MPTAPKKVFVGLSGGVDSSVAALRLLKAGYEVTGVFIKVWHPDFLVCNWEQERLDAMRVAAKLGIPFLTCDAETAYRDEVAHYFIESYREGLTPNPDVMCNKEVKFGAFMRFAQERGADYIATGHYAQKVGHTLLRGVDTNKDQSYFLWTLTPEQLAYTLLPVGDSNKDVIRAEAAAAGLLTASKKDSQGVCFLGHIDIPDFLSHYIDLAEGDVLDEAGVIVGRHRGAFVYTIGQRHGFTLTTPRTDSTPHYVIRKDVTANTITVSTTPPQATAGDTIELRYVVLRQPVSLGNAVHVQTRYRQTPSTMTVIHLGEDTMTLRVEGAAEAVASGQSCVLYAGDVCLGGGMIR